jgi:hypothetical protein
MPKEKLNVIIDGITYEDVLTSVYKNYNGKLEYTIDTSGINQIIRQYIKNKYGAIKVWARLNRFAGGTSIGIDLWEVPYDWYQDISSFANKFGKYHVYDGYGDGYWRGNKVGATLKDGTPVGNDSPYVSVGNEPPYNAKERDMTPPDYTEKKKIPEKKEYKGGFKSKFKKESKTEGFEHIYTCGNGWKVFLKYEAPKYTYRVVKDYNVKPVGKEQFYELKGDMLQGGFEWSVKAQCFERNTIGLKLEREFFEQIVCNILSKFFPKIGEFESQIKESESSTEATIPSSKIPIKSIKLLWDNEEFNSFNALDAFLKVEYYENSETKLPNDYYDKYKIEFIWEDGSRIVDRIDISNTPTNYNPFRENLSDYYKRQVTENKEFTAFYEGDINSPFENLSFADISESTIPSSEINLEQLISDMQVLVDLTIDEGNKLSLLQYISDLQTLKMLEN